VANLASNAGVETARDSFQDLPDSNIHLIGRHNSVGDPFPPVPINKRAFKQRRLISLREEKGLKNEIIVRRLKTKTSKAP
jgi:hypothetical protein